MQRPRQNGQRLSVSRTARNARHLTRFSIDPDHEQQLVSVSHLVLLSLRAQDAMNAIVGQSWHPPFGGESLADKGKAGSTTVGTSGAFAARINANADDGGDPRLSFVG